MTDYHYPAVTVDIAVLNNRQNHLELLLIERKNPPFQGAWALPGGFIEPDETLEVSALRELEEETGLRGVQLSQVGVFGDPGRDPRGRTITVVFRTVLENYTGMIHGQDDAVRAEWFSIEDLPQLAFDHAEIVRTVLEDLKA